MTRLQAELACRDQIIVALQHIVRELRHELENLRTGHLYARSVADAPSSERDR